MANVLNVYVQDGNTLLRIGHPSYFRPFLLLFNSNTRQGRQDRRFLEVPQFCPSLYKLKNHFGYNFVFVTPTVWNELPDDVNSVSPVTSIEKKSNYISIRIAA